MGSIERYQDIQSIIENIAIIHTYAYAFFYSLCTAMAKKATLYKKLPDNKVMCLTCNHYCPINPGETGKCGIRKNQDGELYLLVYGKAL